MARWPERQHLSVTEYLEGELVSEIRHEYIDGEVYAMVEASDRHNLIALCVRIPFASVENQIMRGEAS